MSSASMQENTFKYGRSQKLLRWISPSAEPRGPEEVGWGFASYGGFRWAPGAVRVRDVRREDR